MMRDYGGSELNSIPDPFYSRVVREYNRLKGFLPHQHGYVYIIQGVGVNFMKIGKSVNPDKRHLQISPTVPFETRVLKIWPSNFMTHAEVWLHSQFDQFRMNGEWFALEVEQLKEMIYEDPHSYSDQIRHAYGFTFLNHVAQDADGYRQFRDWLSSRDEGVYLGASGMGGSRQFISLIESWLLEISLGQTGFDIPSDVSDPWNRERALSAIEFESGTGWGGDR